MTLSRDWVGDTLRQCPRVGLWKSAIVKRAAVQIVHGSPLLFGYQPMEYKATTFATIVIYLI